METQPAVLAILVLPILPVIASPSSRDLPPIHMRGSEDSVSCIRQTPSNYYYYNYYYYYYYYYYCYYYYYYYYYYYQ